MTTEETKSTFSSKRENSDFSNPSSRNISSIFSWRILLGFFLLAFLVRGVLWLGISVKNPDGFLLTDSADYIHMAENIRNHGSFSRLKDNLIRQDVYRLPVYGLFLAFFQILGLNISSIIFAQLIFGSVSCVVVLLWSYHLFKNRKVAYLSSLLFAFHVPSILWTNVIVTETILSFFLFLSLFALSFHLESNKDWFCLVLSSFLLGIGLLTHPMLTYFPIFVMGALFFLKRAILKKRFLYLFLFLFVLLTTLSPWLLYNQRDFGKPIFSTSGSYNFIISRAGCVRYLQFKDSITYSGLVLHGEAIKQFGKDPAENLYEFNQFLFKFGLNYIAQHPFYYAACHIKGFIKLFFSPSRSTLDLQLDFLKNMNPNYFGVLTFSPKEIFQLILKSHPMTLFVIFFQFFYMAFLWPGLLWGIFLIFKKRNTTAIVTLLPIFFYFSIFMSGPEVFARFRVPMAPMMTILSSWGWINLWEIFKNRSNRSVS